MSTQLTRVPGGWAVATVAAEGKQKKMGRGTVIVPDGDKEALRAEIVRQAEAVRKTFKVNQTTKETVV